MSDKTYNYTRQKLPSPRIMSGKQRVCAGLHHVSGPRCGVFQRSDAWPHLSKGAAHSVKLRKTGMAGPAVLPTEPTDLCIQTLVTDLCIQTLVTLT